MNLPNAPRLKDRTFADVVPPQGGATAPITTRAAPPLHDLGPLQQLCGVWTGTGTGWNMIALPFHQAPPAPHGFKFRVLMNQYDEELKFTFVDDGVKNRGLLRAGESDFDQVVATLDYQQKIAQTAADDFPPSPDRGLRGLAIHHEPGLWLYEKNLPARTDTFDGKTVSERKLDIARLASVPHGNSVLAVGYHESHDGMPPIPAMSGFPQGRFEDVKGPAYDFKSDDYLAPYKHYVDHPFKGEVRDAGFPGFSPVDMNELLRFVNRGVKIARTTVLTVDSDVKSGGIRNLPFSVREAEPVSLKSTFWIQELEDQDADGNPLLRLQYSQVVMLHFFSPREDGFPGRAVWPHISIATLTKTVAPYALVPA